MTPVRADRLVPLLLLLGGAAARAAGEDARGAFARAAEAMKTGRSEDALAAYGAAETAAATPAGRAGALNGAGFALLKLRRYPEAVERLDRAVGVNPKHKEAWNNLGTCWLRLYETGLSGTTALDSALTAYGRVAALDPAHRPGNLAAANAYAEQEAVWAAAAAVRGPAPRAPADAAPWAEYKLAGERAEREGDLAFARANWERAEAVAPTKKARCAAANMLGLLALRARDPRAAVDALKRATTVDAGTKFAWNNLGVALLRAYDASAGGRELVEQAVDAFRRVQALDAAYKPENLAWGEERLAELNLAAPSATISR
jgi:tetratricopeptide (TPR) repeat protein